MVVEELLSSSFYNEMNYISVLIFLQLSNFYFWSAKVLPTKYTKLNSGPRLSGLVIDVGFSLTNSKSGYRSSCKITKCVKISYNKEENV
jgi:hypothetical protein